MKILALLAFLTIITLTYGQDPPQTDLPKCDSELDPTCLNEETSTTIEPKDGTITCNKDSDPNCTTAVEEPPKGIIHEIKHRVKRFTLGLMNMFGNMVSGLLGCFGGFGGGGWGGGYPYGGYPYGGYPRYPGWGWGSWGK